jgi:hypothetical protein
MKAFLNAVIFSVVGLNTEYAARKKSMVRNNIFSYYFRNIKFEMGKRVFLIKIRCNKQTNNYLCVLMFLLWIVFR